MAKYDRNIELEKQCRLEIQIRTKLQHSWATAVEVLGTYLNQPLKQSLGDDKYLDIFKDISKLFVGLESKDIDHEFVNYKFVKKVEDNIEDIKLLEKLKTFNIVTKHLSNHTTGQYALLKTDFKQETIEIKRYGKAKFEQANEDYLQIELENLNNKAVEIVLISIQDIENLKKSYPNYFMDTTDFIKNLNTLFDSVEQKQKLQVMINKSENEDEKKVLNSLLNSIFKNMLKPLK